MYSELSPVINVFMAAQNCYLKKAPWTQAIRCSLCM